MITDELREWTRRYAYFKADLTAIADRIDAKHRKALERVAAMVDEPDGKREAYYDRFIARMVDGDATTVTLDSLERRVERIERLLSHKGGAE